MSNTQIKFSLEIFLYLGELFVAQNLILYKVSYAQECTKGCLIKDSAETIYFSRQNSFMHEITQKSCHKCHNMWSIRGSDCSTDYSAFVFHPAGGPKQYVG